MPVHISYHEPLYNAFGLNPVLGKQIGDRESLAVSGAVANANPPSTTKSVLARISTTEACALAIGNGNADGAKSEYWPAGIGGEVRWISKGEHISVIAAA